MPSLAAARTYFIGSDSGSGDFPWVFAISKTVYRPAKFFIQVSASRASVDGSDYVSCYRGAKHRSYQYDWRDSPGYYGVGLSMWRPTYCWMSESLDFPDFDGGSLSVSMYAQLRPPF